MLVGAQKTKSYVTLHALWVPKKRNLTLLCTPFGCKVTNFILKILALMIILFENLIHSYILAQKMPMKWQFYITNQKRENTEETAILPTKAQHLIIYNARASHKAINGKRQTNRPQVHDCFACECGVIYSRVRSNLLASAE